MNLSDFCDDPEKLHAMMHREVSDKESEAAVADKNKRLKPFGMAFAKCLSECGPSFPDALTFEQEIQLTMAIVYLIDDIIQLSTTKKQ